MSGSNNRLACLQSTAEITKKQNAGTGKDKTNQSSLVLTSIEGEVEGKNKSGRRRTAWINNEQHGHCTGNGDDEKWQEVNAPHGLWLR